MPENNRQKFFIDWVLDNSQKDNGFSAKMRRADNPDQEYYALGILCGFGIDIEMNRNVCLIQLLVQRSVAHSSKGMVL